jgi:tRNA threonylcarbamoyladenosine biosynthesis protein TsaE
VITANCPDAAATQALAAGLAPVLQPGDLVLVEGDLGAGKTTFTQGLAKALGVAEAVTSPTFVLMNIHPTAAGFDLVHVDLYRLERLSEVVDLALPELLEDGAVVVVEWGLRAAAALPGDHLLVRIDGSPDGGSPDGGSPDGGRTVTVELHGRGWAGRLDAIGSLA